MLKRVLIINFRSDTSNPIKHSLKTTIITHTLDFHRNPIKEEHPLSAININNNGSPKEHNILKNTLHT